MAAMSTDPHNPPQNAPHQPGLTDLDAFLATSTPPRSLAAWGGFILSLVLLAPWVPFLFRRLTGMFGLITGGIVGGALCLLASLLGVIGIFRTRHRSRRGRMVAIAAIPLGLLGGFLQVVFGFMSFGFLGVKMEGDRAVQLLRTPAASIAEQAASWRSEHGSKRFQANVTEEAMAGWLADVVAKHGQMQSTSVSRNDMFRQDRGAMVYRLNGQFVNDTAPVEMIIGFESNMQPRVDDIRVDGSSPRNWSPAKPGSE